MTPLKTDTNNSIMVLGGVFMYSIKKCNKDDIWRIRDFLQETYGNFEEKVNWHIDRLNFTYSMSRIMNGVSDQSYRDRIRIFEKDGQILSFVNTEGENRGEVFFQIPTYNLEKNLIKDMFDYAESISNEMFLRINSHAVELIKEAEIRGYKKEDWSEITSVMPLNQVLPYSLPTEFHFGHATNKEKALGHGMAFGYADQLNYLKRSERGLKELENMDDYNEKFDIQVCNAENQVLAFATVWYDQKNKLGILEPVGTHPDYRKRGLAKAAIYEGCNRIFKAGARKVYVGSDQAFYKRIGFMKASEDLVYKYLKKC